MAGGKTKLTQNTNLDDAKARFSKALNFALLHKFGRVPTANSLANQFNFRAVGMTAVTRETARKWLCGLAIPEVAKLIVLIDWLGIDANEFMSKRIASVRTDADVVIDTISELLKHMDEKNRNVVLITAWALRETEGLKTHKLDLQTLRRALMFNLSNENHHLP